MQPEMMLHRSQQRLLNRLRRIRGQVNKIDDLLTAGATDVDALLMLLATVRGGVNSLMAEVLERHIAQMLSGEDGRSTSSAELKETLVDLLRAYLK